MRIKEAAARAGVSVKALRYYEALGLVTPERMANGYRDYSPLDVRMAAEIRSLRELGIPVESARPFLDCLASGHKHGDECPASLAGYRNALSDLDRRIAALQHRRSLLSEQLHVAAGRLPQEARPRPKPSIPDDRRSTIHQTRTTHVTDFVSLPSNLPAPEDDGAAAHLPGLFLPELTLETTTGTHISLDALPAGRAIIYIYPLTGLPGTDLPDGWDSIPGARGCTPEACGFRDHFEELVDAGAAAVYGLSSQTSEYQRELVERLHLPFDILSDVALELADALNMPTFMVDGQRLYKRQTLVVTDRQIEHVFYPIFPPDRHAAQVLDWLTTSRCH